MVADGRAHVRVQLRGLEAARARRSGELGDLYYLDTARLNLGLYQHDVNVRLRPRAARHLDPQLRAGRTRRRRRVLGLPARPPPARGRRLPAAVLRRRPASTANIHVSWLDPCKVRRVTVVGQPKMVVFDDLAAEERIRVHDKGVVPARTTDDLSQPPMSYRYGDDRRARTSRRTNRSPSRTEHFVDCVADRHACRSRTARTGSRSCEVLEAASCRCGSGRAVDHRRSPRQARRAPAARTVLPETAPARRVGSRR